ncbi:MAG: zinc ribbon domain-containing protein [Oscillospiraceae bacterium]|nr:zinc ribbon domain-containing protein [Oscillospiraceae bacterium]
MTCTKCGYDNKDGSKFCLKCGNRLAEEAQSEICYDKQNIPDENNVCTEISDTVKNITDKSEQTAGVIIDPPHKNINKNLVIALSAAAVIIISAAAAGILSKNNDDEVSFISVSDTETQTTLTEAVTSATTAKTTVTAKQTTRATSTTTEVTTTTQAETLPLRSNAASYYLSCGTIDFVDNNEFYKFIGDYWDEYYILNYQLTPRVNLTNSEVSSRIESELTYLLSSPSIGASEDFIRVYTLPNNIYSKSIVEYEKRIESVYEENGILFISILDYMNDEFDDYTYVIVNGYIFDLSFGEQYSFFDFVTDKDKFENAVNEYIQNHVYFAEYNNNWVYGNMRYDGENLYINYQEYTVDIPAYVWRDYVDFSVNNSSSKISVTNIDDSYKEDKSYTTEPGYIEGPPSNFDELGLYWIFSDMLIRRKAAKPADNKR